MGVIESAALYYTKEGNEGMEGDGNWQLAKGRCVSHPLSFLGSLERGLLDTRKNPNH